MATTSHSSELIELHDKIKNMSPDEFAEFFAGDDVEEMEAIMQERDELRSQIEALGENSVPADQLARLQADFENFRKRSRRQQDEAGAQASAKVITDLLPVLDNLELAISHIEDDGIKMVMTQMQGLLAKYGVEIIDPAGEEFDPHFHNGVNRIDGGEANIIAEVLQKGYRTEASLLRPAAVVIYGG